MRARTRLRVSAPTSAQPRTTLDTVMTETFRSCAMSFRRTGELGGLDMVRQCAHRRARSGRPKREYTRIGDEVCRSPNSSPLWHTGSRDTFPREHPNDVESAAQVFATFDSVDRP